LAITGLVSVFFLQQLAKLVSRRIMNTCSITSRFVSISGVVTASGLLAQSSVCQKQEFAQNSAHWSTEVTVLTTEFNNKPDWEIP
jgi:hypothetical protein